MGPGSEAGRRRAGGQRFRATAQADGAPGVVLDGDAVPEGPLLCLHRVGAFYGQQRRGSGRPAPPAWWTTSDGLAEVDARVRAVSPEPQARRGEDALAP